MVRKIASIFVVALVLITALCGTVQAATHTVYENGNLSNTYVTYFKDIVAGIGFKENYVAFRSGQYSYTMVVGELEYTDGKIFTDKECREYTFATTESGYNQQYYYNVDTIDNFSLDVGNYILYSDVGDFPQLVERGAKYEIFTAVLLCVALLCIVFGRFFKYNIR